MTRMRGLAAIFLIICGATLAGCATDKPLETSCPALDRFIYPRLGESAVAQDNALAASPPSQQAPSQQVSAPLAANDNPSPPEHDSMDSVLDQAYRVPSQITPPSQPQYSDALILSGGGQWGAFGAGVLTGWAIHGRLPARIITGISTGSLQASFVYLGDDKGLIDAYSIQSESQLVKRYGNGFFLHHASTADIAPLKSYVTQHIGPLIPKVAAEYSKSGRKLLVGAVDALSGDFHVFDLTEIASAPDLTTTQKRDCYIGALLASSAVPVIFRQVTINNRPWLDGGLRHAVFLPEIMRRISEARARAGHNAAATDGKVWAIKNGITSISKVDALPAQLLPTILRLRSVVFDQIETDSVDLAAYQAQRYGLTLYATSADGWNKSDLPECKAVAGGAQDSIFNPAFMRCLLSYGEGRWLNGGNPWVRRLPR